MFVYVASRAYVEWNGYGDGYHIARRSGMPGNSNVAAET